MTIEIKKISVVKTRGHFYFQECRKSENSDVRFPLVENRRSSQREEDWNCDPD